jgi:uncharacterized membrane protein YphA (DoxX/SURF4 family)
MARRSSSDIPSGMPPGVPAFVTWVGGPIELFGGLFVMFGLFTRWAAFIAVGMMAAAYWMAARATCAPAHREPGRGRGGLLLRLPLHRRARTGDLERDAGTRSA